MRLSYKHGLSLLSIACSFSTTFLTKIWTGAFEFRFELSYFFPSILQITLYLPSVVDASIPFPLNPIFYNPVFNSFADDFLNNILSLSSFLIANS